MKHGATQQLSTRKSDLVRQVRFPVALSILTVLIWVAAVAAPSASAAPLQQVANFAESGEELQLGGVAGMAVNYTGAGNVPAGTVYAATFFPAQDGVAPRVAMFYPKVGGGLTFEKSWAVSVSGGGSISACGPLVSGTPCLARPEGSTNPRVDVDIDQATGNVYFLRPQGSAAGQKEVVEFDAKGEAEITRFGEQAASGAKIEATPEQLHVMPAPGGLAVTSAGRVYVYDAEGANQYYRLAVFEPSTAGDFSHYQYKGEVAGGTGSAHVPIPQSPVVDAVGNVFTVGEEGERIVEYAPETPGTFPKHSTPTCTFTYKTGGILSITVNPETDEVFFFSGKPAKTPRIHRLGACAAGQFAQIEELEWHPERYGVTGLTVDPLREFDPIHSPGVLYGGAPERKENQSGTSVGYIFASLAEERPPAIESFSASNVTATGARLSGSVEPNGHLTTYSFQYLTNGTYEANDPDEVQSLTVSASSGVFGLNVEGEGFGGSATANLTSGSRQASISGPGAASLAVGETVEGAGIAAGTTITAKSAGQVMLSQAATATATGVEIHAGLPFDATAGQLRRALEGLGTVGRNNVVVTGGPGDSTGSEPYRVTFTGELGNRNIGQMVADGTRLGGGSAVVATLEQGGGGFAGAAEITGTVDGAVPQPVVTTLSNLMAGTAYRYRLVVRSNCDPAEVAKVCEAATAPQELRTYLSAPPLPDGRAWERVSPSGKAGGQVLPAEPLIDSCPGLQSCKPGVGLEHFPMQSTPGGERVAFEGTPFGEAGGASSENEYVSGRDAQSGWQTGNPSPPTMLSPAGQGYKYLSENLEVAVIKQNSLALVPAAPAGYANLYVQNMTNPAALEPVLISPPPNRLAVGSEGEKFHITFVGASSDGSRIFFLANDALTGATAFAPKAKDGGAADFNLYEWHKGAVVLANVSPDNATTEPGVAVAPPSTRAVSADGSHVFFENPAGRVYVRIDARETRRIEDSGRFRVASTSGKEVLLSDGCLYSIETESCTDLTSGMGGFLGVTGESEDLSHVYFVDSEALNGEEENSQGEVAAEGAPNLYAWSQGAGSRFVARLDSKDNLNTGGGGGVADWAPTPANRTAEASPDGRYLAFLSRAALTEYDNTGPCEEISGTGTFRPSPCPEVYVFDSATGILACASCDPAGPPPLGWSVLRRIKQGEMLAQPRYLSDTGRLAFDSQDALSQFDTNGSAEDVYEWEPAGVGGCDHGEGCVGLLSSGREGSDSNLVGTDETGKNVFFTTRQQLLPIDTDDLVDLYDAREGGGFPFESELSTPSECQGDGCQATPPPPSATPPPPATLPPPRNYVPPKKCAKGKVKKGNKCVAKKSGKKTRPKSKKSKAGRAGVAQANGDGGAVR